MVVTGRTVAALSGKFSQLLSPTRWTEESENEDRGSRLRGAFAAFIAEYGTRMVAAFRGSIAAVRQGGSFTAHWPGATLTSSDTSAPRSLQASASAAFTATR
jgi:hypothetical protein